MIKTVMVENYLGDKLELELASPEKSGFAVVAISGLGPGAATVNVSEIPTNDGARYNSSRRPSRNIVLGLIFQWQEGLVSGKRRIIGTIEDARIKSYKYFPLKKNVKLTITTDNRKAEIEGYVESNDPTIFSKGEGTTISIICPDPNFYSVVDNGVQSTIFSALEPAFQFPIGTEDYFEVGIISPNPQKLIIYNGDVEFGMNIIMTATGTASGVTIYDMTTLERMEIDSVKLEEFTGTGIIDGDKIIISTVKGKKGMILERSGETFNILNCLTEESSWFTLKKGDNIFSYTADTGSNNLRFQIDNKIVYEGV